MCYCGNKGDGTDTEIRVSTKKSEKKILPPLLSGLEPATFRIKLHKMYNAGMLRLLMHSLI